MYVHELRVRYAECDMQGHVFNANYLTWADTAHTELWRSVLGPYGAFVASGYEFVVAELGARYRSAARFDDDLAIEVRLDPLTTSSMTSRYRMLRGDELLVEAWVRHVCVDGTSFAKAAWPEPARAALQAHVEPPAA